MEKYYAEESISQNKIESRKLIYLQLKLRMRGAKGIYEWYRMINNELSIWILLLFVTQKNYISNVFLPMFIAKRIYQRR